METGKYIYKCKNCGEEFKGSASSDYTTMHLNLMAIMKTGLPIQTKCSVGQHPEKYIIHHCAVDDPESDKYLGIAEMVGLIKEES